MNQNVPSGTGWACARVLVCASVCVRVRPCIIRGPFLGGRLHVAAKLLESFALFAVTAGRGRRQGRGVEGDAVGVGVGVLCARIIACYRHGGYGLRLRGRLRRGNAVVGAENALNRINEALAPTDTFAAQVGATMAALSRRFEPPRSFCKALQRSSPTAPTDELQQRCCLCVASPRE